MNNKSVFHAPLNPQDTQSQTVGCRHTSPDICGKNSMANVCALVRSDGICLSPPRSWPKQFIKLMSKK